MSTKENRITPVVGVWLYFAPPAGDACTVGVNVNAGEEVTVTASELGDVANHFLNVTNNEGTDGSYSVVVEL